MSENTMGVDLHANFFELFALPIGYEVELSSIKKRYLELQRIVHPDRFADQGERGQRMAVQYATFVNEAFETLCSPLKRARYLLELSGHPVDVERNTVMDATFLMEQLSLREELTEVRDGADPEAAIEPAIEDLRERAERLMDKLQVEFLGHWQVGDNYDQAADCVRKMYFAHKLLVEIEQLEEDFLDS